MAGIDSMKGLLILLVVLGHALPGSLEDSLPRFLIYSFHMQIFLAICGYLTTREKLRKNSLATLFRGYWRRMILPWLVAVVVFFLVVHYKELWQSPLDLKPLAKSLALQLPYPFFHLWFVPALVMMILVVYGIERLPWDCGIAVYLSSVALYIVFASYPGRSVPHLVLLGDRRWYLFFCFFYLGFLLRNRVQRQNLSAAVLGLLVAVLATCRIWQFYHPPYPAVGCGLVWLLTVALTLLCLQYFAQRHFWGGKWLSLLGIESLAIYLWHPLLLRGLSLLGTTYGADGADESHSLGYYLALSPAMVGFVAIIYWASEWPLARKYFLGTPPVTLSLGKSPTA